MFRGFFKPVLTILLCGTLAATCFAASKSEMRAATVTSTPMNSGRITNMLYGGFIELLDDLVPGMWAEMLNDRGFEGVKPLNWSYYTSEPNTCDRDWDKSDTWSYDTVQPFNGKQSVKITASKDKAGTLSQQGLAVKKSVDYLFTGNFRTDNPRVQVKVKLKALLPDGKWMILASSPISKISDSWSKTGCALKSIGDTDRAVFELEVTGTGSVWVDKISLMPSDNVDGWRKDVVEVIEATKPGVIRFGGSLAEYGYKWQNGTGDRDHREPFWNQYWGRIDTNDVGIDEFVSFCRAAGAEPLICASFSDGKENAQAMVEYCNGDANTKYGKMRTDNGHAEPYGVKYWQVGNETTGEKYDNECASYCEAMLKADPKITLIASDINTRLLNNAGKYLSYACRHIYYANYTEECEATLRRDQKTIDNANLDHKVGLAVTEWNLSAADWGLGRGKMLTLEAALYNARLLNKFNDYSDVVGIACRSNMTNSMGSGFIITKQDGILKTPAYYVLKLYADHYKPIPVSVYTRFSDIDLSACKSDDNNKLTVFAVNTSESPVQMQLDLSAYPGFSPVGGEIVCDTLDRRQPELLNQWTAPDRVRAINLTIKDGIVTLPAYSVAAIECSVSN